MREVFNELTPSEKKIANYIFNNSENVSKLSTGELAEVSKTSAASITRFARKLGFDGFQELKIDIAKSVAINGNTGDDSVYEAVRIHDNTREIIQKIALGNIKAIEETVSVIDEEAISKSITAINMAKKINIYGVGASGLVGLDLQYKLMRINKQANMFLDSHTQLASAIHIKKGDVAIGISHSGRTLEVYKALEAAKKQGAITISITKYGKHPISDLADINIYTASVEKHLRTGAIASRIAQLTVVDILFIGVAKDNFGEITRYLQHTREIVDDLKL
ncbi:MurR/RpiR family transcriptional regulator [Alkaliphilus sp. B6464]|uniref:MurR/RpiR family transcriptional regulator n=1 Tax=Alkaliphilus sp. B6464 TaxID=2731219 RepID=UPI001BA4B9E8|nr:MurR/RpiR family transcriptional regulator [Alkaliphilus sp. B6464]QUH18825.1 MurR/RpiR family transcriptional regulator [Alkaliphilus sp. B6464]